ncbi:aldehyde dehydrogenase family protein [Amylibacter sp.]|nr:aldehyde dehydrogenase family protein [Amylibacter sp.]MDC0087507.1 aldehyde dehydrogenase family protein [Amylibacter sp.]
MEGGYYIQPTVFKGTNDMRIFQEEIFECCQTNLTSQ